MQATKNGDPKYTFPDRSSADRLTREACEKGSPLKRRPNVGEFDFQRPIGKHPNGGYQTRERVHSSKSGIHGHPSGPTVK